MARQKKTNSQADTSQGWAKDLPPEDFIPQELVNLGTTQTRPQYVPDLTNWHPFYEELWRIDHERYELLEQAFRLSARLLLVGLPGFICNFLPKPQRIWSRGNKTRIALFPRNAVHMRWALHHLRTEIMPNVRFLEDANIWLDMDIMSLTHTDMMMPVEDTRQQGPQAGDNKYRFLDVTIASQIIDTLRDFPHGTEQHLNALFAATISLTSELANVLWLANPRHGADYVWADNDIEASLGKSFLAHLFNGWYPEPIMLKDMHELYYTFETGYQWVKMYRRPCKQPFAQVYYSVPMDFIQQLFREKSWAPYNEMSIESIDKIKKNLLDPKAPFSVGKHARRARVLFRDDWKRQVTMEGYEESDNDSESSEVDLVLYGPGKGSKVFFDSDWNEMPAWTEGQLAAENEKKKKYLIKVNNLAHEPVGEIARHRVGDLLRTVTGTRSRRTADTTTTDKKMTGTKQRPTKEVLAPATRKRTKTPPATTEQKVSTAHGDSAPEAPTDKMGRLGLRSHRTLTPIATAESTSSDEAGPSGMPTRHKRRKTNDKKIAK